MTSNIIDRLDALRDFPLCWDKEVKQVLNTMGRPAHLSFCKAYMGYMTATEQHALAQHFVREFVMCSEHIDIMIAWRVFKAFRADACVPEHVRRDLPQDVSEWLTSKVVSGDLSLADVLGLGDMRHFLVQFGWTRLAITCRAQLRLLLSTNLTRLPVHLWTVIQATWMLIDADAMLGLSSLRTRVIAEGYGFAKNLSAITLAAAATRDFLPIEDADVAAPCVACCAGAGGR
jgi:hypothetical protein